MRWKARLLSHDRYSAQRLGADLRRDGPWLFRGLDSRRRQRSRRRAERAGDGLCAARLSVRGDRDHIADGAVVPVAAAARVHRLHAGALCAVLLDAAPPVWLGIERGVGPALTNGLPNYAAAGLPLITAVFGAA